MKTDSHGPIDTRIHTSMDGRAVIEQSTGASVVLTADQILTVISQLQACYDYCAAWKEQAPHQDDATTEPPP
jgi:hypothetical protein